MQKTSTMETTHYIIAYKSLKSRQVNFQPLRLFPGIKRIVFQPAQAQIWTDSGQAGTQNADLHSGAKRPLGQDISFHTQDPFSSQKGAQGRAGLRQPSLCH